MTFFELFFQNKKDIYIYILYIRYITQLVMLYTGKVLKKHKESHKATRDKMFLLLLLLWLLLLLLLLWLLWLLLWWWWWWWWSITDGRGVWIVQFEDATAVMALPQYPSPEIKTHGTCMLRTTISHVARTERNYW